MDLNVQGGSPIQVSDAVFGAEFKETLIHQVVHAFMAGARAGTKAQKNRAAVRGGGAKPWRQKGTGRARAGTISSPIFRSGGVNFAASPRSYEQKVNRKMYRGAICSILSELLRQDRLVVVDSFKIDEPKTKAVMGKLKELDMNDVLIVTEEMDVNLLLATRNVYGVDVCEPQDINPVALVGFEKILVTAGALKQLEERLA
jgi:large subunit ribosomal protein L4